MYKRIIRIASTLLVLAALVGLVGTSPVEASSGSTASANVPSTAFWAGAWYFGVNGKEYHSGNMNGMLPVCSPIWGLAVLDPPTCKVCIGGNCSYPFKLD